MRGPLISEQREKSSTRKYCQPAALTFLEEPEKVFCLAGLNKIKSSKSTALQLFLRDENSSHIRSNF